MPSDTSYGTLQITNSKFKWKIVMQPRWRHRKCPCPASRKINRNERKNKTHSKANRQRLNELSPRSRIPDFLITQLFFHVNRISFDCRTSSEVDHRSSTALIPRVENVSLGLLRFSYLFCDGDVISGPQ